VLISLTNAGDTQSRIFHKKLVQVDLYKKLDCVWCFLVQVFFLYNNLASVRTELYSTQETCRHVTKIERYDWSAHLLMLTVDDLLFCCLRCLRLRFL